MPDPIRAGELVLLMGPEGERHIVAAGDGTRRVGGLGVLDLAALVGKPWGVDLTLGLRKFRLVRPILPDHLRALQRKAQIVTPKDAARIVFETGLGAGGRVVEAGVGSGALTMALAHAVWPDGRVFAYDLRPDHLATGRRNLGQTPWAGAVEFRQGDVHAGVAETELDAFVLDVPDPERAVDVASKALRSGGVFAAYTPQVTQAKAFVEALAASSFDAAMTLELIERRWALEARSARPEFEMLGHTAFLTFARRR